MATVADPIWSDLHQDIRKDGRGGVKVSTNVDAVVSSISNILGIRPGEFPMYPNAFSGIGSLLFEPCTSMNLQKIAQITKQAIETYDDRVFVTAASIKIDPDRHMGIADITFNIRGQSGNFNAVIPLK